MTDPKGPSESFRINVTAEVRKYACDSDADLDLPYEVLVDEGNMLLYGGASALWHFMTDSTPSLTIFDNSNAYLGVGDSSTATTAGMTDLQGSSKLRTAMSATYPLHTDATTSGGASCQFKCSVAAGSGTFDWNEWGLFNASTGGRMFNRKVKAFGTKGAGDTWTLTVTFSAS